MIVGNDQCAQALISRYQYEADKRIGEPVSMEWICPHCGKLNRDIVADGNGMMLVCHYCHKEA